jgi:hypothetical protein
MNRGKPATKGKIWDNDFLWTYLKGDLPEKESRQIQYTIDSNPFLKDAVEGLMSEKDEQAVRDSVLLLQKQLKRHIHSRKKRRHSLMKPNLWLWVSVGAIVLFVLIAWWIITLMLH